MQTSSMVPERHSLICWRSAFAGLFVTFLVLTMFGALGMAFGGGGLYDGTTLKSASLFTGIWFLVTVMIALFSGSYFAARVSKFSVGRVGAAQGLLVASIFFAILIYQAASTVGWLGRTAGSAVAGTASIAAQSVGAASQSSPVNEVIEDSMGDLNVPQERIQAVATGVATRVLNGNTEGAKNYLARQAGITPAEADARIAAAKVKIQDAAVTAREKTASAMQTTGYLLLALLALGSIASVIGGMLGSRSNMTAPVIEETKVAPQVRMRESYV